MKHQLLWIFFISLLMIGFCAPRAPVSIEPGKEECAHCKMTIMDMKFNTQLQTDKGKIYHFDSIECLMDWIQKHPEIKIKNAWVKDYLTKEWIEYKKAIYLISPDIPSPMGGNLSAYKDKKQLDMLPKKGEGDKIFSFSELIQHLQHAKDHEKIHHH